MLGFTSVLLLRQQALGLDAMDINVLLHILKHWCKPEENPYPAKSSIARCMGVDERTVQRRIAKMEKAGLLKRDERWHEKYGRQSNYYDLSGLVDKLKPLAEEELEAKEIVSNQKRARAARTKARPK